MKVSSALFNTLIIDTLFYTNGRLQGPMIIQIYLEESIFASLPLLFIRIPVLSLQFELPHRVFHNCTKSLARRLATSYLCFSYLYFTATNKKVAVFVSLLYCLSTPTYTTEKNKSHYLCLIYHVLAFSTILYFFFVQDLLLVHRLCPSSFFVDSFFSRRFSWIS